jgi:hypothetical protein
LDDDHFDDYLALPSPGLEEFLVLNSREWPDPRKRGIKRNRLNRVFNWKASRDCIHVGDEDGRYEFLVFDWAGNLLKEPRKVYSN